MPAGHPAGVVEGAVSRELGNQCAQVLQESHAALLGGVDRPGSISNQCAVGQLFLVPAPKRFH